MTQLKIKTPISSSKWPISVRNSQYSGRNGHFQLKNSHFATQNGRFSHFLSVFSWRKWTQTSPLTSFCDGLIISNGLSTEVQVFINSRLPSESADTSEMTKSFCGRYGTPICVGFRVSTSSKLSNCWLVKILGSPGAQYKQLIIIDACGAIFEAKDDSYSVLFLRK